MNSELTSKESLRRAVPLPDSLGIKPKIVFTDVDDTLTWKGELPWQTFVALDQLRNAGIQVVPVTGACAGWCDCIIKTWPISAIIGENGAFYMERGCDGVVATHHIKNTDQISKDLIRLKVIGSELARRCPTVGYTQDQAYRTTDVAFDIGQTVQVADQEVENAVQWLQAQGVSVRRSSIHINAWIGNHGKASTAIAWLKRQKYALDDSIFIGDSPNDESMFEKIPLTIGVANIERFLGRMEFVPNFITPSEGGYGFVDLSVVLLADTC